MTKTEKVALLQAKGAEMIAYFDGKELPKSPFKIKPWATILDAKKYLDSQVTRMQHWQNNPFNQLYVLAYYSLKELREYMEANTTKKPANGKRKTERVGPGSKGDAPEAK